MEVQNVLRMTGGQGETSYAMNSEVQKLVISKAKPIVQNSVIDLYRITLPKCFAIADLGCSSGPNSLLAISQIIEAVLSTCQELGHTRSPEFQVLLNDLPGNDFNTIFQSVPYFIEKLKKDKGGGFRPCFISGVPGSFYGRLFPTNTINFVHSSYSLQILSQVPLGIEDNRKHIYLTEESPPNVIEAYFGQFQKDFTLFLSSRSEEVVAGGRMVITVIGRKSPDRTSKECCDIWELVAKSLRDMVSEGTVEPSKLDSFHWPGYYASPEELKTIVQDQGSFDVAQLEVFDVNWDANYHLKQNKDSAGSITRGQYVSKYMRAVMESTIASHFGEDIIEALFQKYAEHVGEHLVKDDGKFVNVVICMTKKA